VGLGAVLVISANKSANDGATSEEFPPDGWMEPSGTGPGPSLRSPLECVEIVGRSLLERLIERFVAIDVECISVLVAATPSLRVPPFRASYGNVTIQVVRDLHSAIADNLADYSRQGIAHSFVNWANAYAETDLLDLFCFHREARQAVTRAFDEDGLLNLWVVDCIKAQNGDLERLLEDASQNEAPKYFIREYVNRLIHPRDLRRLAADILRRTCETGPSGKQLRPGIWIDDDAQVHRRARLVAPAYVGCRSKVRADALITRCSDIERECCIDSGTVIEDSSILANTSIGICLDLCHAVASGNKLWNLDRDVAIEIVDPDLMRFTTAVREPIATSSQRIEAVEETTEIRPTHEMPVAWQLGNNLIQE
jgi:NDP-sugar pyrophosphorylase family protein